MILCKHCQEVVEPVFRERPDTPHAGELRCPECRSFLCWKPKEKNQPKLEKRPACPTPEDLRLDYCQICLRKKVWLGKNETLETHHIDDDPTHNERLNYLVVCTMCHKWIAWVRLYVNQHLQALYTGKTGYEAYEDAKKRLSKLDLPPDEYQERLAFLAQVYEI